MRSTVHARSRPSSRRAPAMDAIRCTGRPSRLTMAISFAFVSTASNSAAASSGRAAFTRRSDPPGTRRAPPRTARPSARAADRAAGAGPGSSTRSSRPLRVSNARSPSFTVTRSIRQMPASWHVSIIRLAGTAAPRRRGSESEDRVPGRVFLQERRAVASARAHDGRTRVRRRAGARAIEAVTRRHRARAVSAAAQSRSHSVSVRTKSLAAKRPDRD